MTIQAAWCKHTLNFKFTAGTSRGSMTDKTSYFLKIWDKNNPECYGIGEAGPLSGLSTEFETIESEIESLVSAINSGDDLTKNNRSSSITCALEMAQNGLNNKSFDQVFPGRFSSGNLRIPINGLIWMGNPDFMQKQITQKLEQGFTTIKLKIGALDFDTEFEIIKDLRSKFKASDLTIRVDANGAFDFKNAQKVLNKLYSQQVHSIEQPIKAGNWEQMAELCKISTVPIALDEELIGIADQNALLEAIEPAYIILKPSLHGGFENTKKWIAQAEKLGINWWITSALESNIGLNSICQFTSQYENLLPQGLGTGQLYHNNIPSPLKIESGFIDSSGENFWDLSQLKFRS
jgi:o-succinylbenzoate synthase